jgi:hypothetical protein
MAAPARCPRRRWAAPENGVRIDDVSKNCGNVLRQARTLPIKPSLGKRAETAGAPAFRKN